MREKWARGLALATGVLVLLLSAAFAVMLNPSDRTPVDDRKPVAGAVPALAADASGGAAGAAASAGRDANPASPLVARGQAVFTQYDCARCHSVAGKGSPRNPLDGVGSRLSRDELHDWVVAGEAVRADLSPRTVSAKQRYARMPAADMAALLAYLATLRE